MNVQASVPDIEAPFRWDEQAEIQFVMENEDKECHRCSRRNLKNLHIPRRAELRARHIPGPWYIPAILLTW